MRPGSCDLIQVCSSRVSAANSTLQALTVSVLRYLFQKDELHVHLQTRLKHLAVEYGTIYKVIIQAEDMYMLIANPPTPLWR